MLMRTDSLREFDRLTQQLMGTTARPVAMPIDAYRKDDTFFVHLDLPAPRRRRPHRRAQRAHRARRTTRAQR